MKFFEDLHVGERVLLGSHLFTADDIKTFAAQYDPQRFHVDEEQGRLSPYGALIASGWHTGSIWMRKLVDYHKGEIEAFRERGEQVPALGPSPGFRELKWHKPVFAGDTVTYAIEVVAKRVSQSRPRFGIIETLATGDNQNGARVISFISTTFIERRSTPPE
ncbi:dehydratase [Pseudorhodoplanes sinuspersici]|uniref:Dehydratase n=1 Tax=Pseudorhodoplanes sinuspersici TaxID=1235591 RepID=A0A1W7A1Q1_9HYPH|nr:MaoC family dehydratase [Pseudorhodoplanes sinuspersici]ARQ02945.1 dehydratase [Pseudorhodoplanes sinuspersici]